MQHTKVINIDFYCAECKMKSTEEQKIVIISLPAHISNHFLSKR